MRHTVFLCLDKQTSTVEFPSDIEGNVISATLTHWDMGLYPVAHAPFFQIKFSGALQTRSVAYGGHPSMFQLPCQTLSAPVRMDLRPQPWMRRFEVSVYGPGESPSPIEFPENLYILMWIELVTETH